MGNLVFVLVLVGKTKEINEEKIERTLQDTCQPCSCFSVVPITTHRLGSPGLPAAQVIHISVTFGNSHDRWALLYHVRLFSQKEASNRGCGRAVGALFFSPLRKERNEEDSAPDHVGTISQRFGRPRLVGGGAGPRVGYEDEDSESSFAQRISHPRFQQSEFQKS
jgi:hypothetical protein